MSTAKEVLIWVLFFATNVYGHAGYKQAFREGANSVQSALLSVWGITATLAWCLNAILWIAILQKSQLITAHTTSALTQILVALAALVWFKENLQSSQAVGVVLVIAGVYLVNR